MNKNTFHSYKNRKQWFKKNPPSKPFPFHSYEHRDAAAQLKKMHDVFLKKNNYPSVLERESEQNQKLATEITKKRKPKDLQGYISRILKIAPTVAYVLQNNISTKDNDNLLLLEVWARQTANGIKSYSAFKKLLLGEKITTPETITRTRRKLQEKYPELRGELYEKRKHIEQLVKNELQNQMSFEFMDKI